MRTECKQATFEFDYFTGEGAVRRREDHLRCRGAAVKVEQRTGLVAGLSASGITGIRG